MRIFSKIYKFTWIWNINFSCSSSSKLYCKTICIYYFALSYKVCSNHGGSQKMCQNAFIILFLTWKLYQHATLWWFCNFRTAKIFYLRSSLSCTHNSILLIAWKEAYQKMNFEVADMSQLFLHISNRTFQNWHLGENIIYSWSKANNI